MFNHLIKQPLRVILKKKEYTQILRSESTNFNCVPTHILLDGIIAIKHQTQDIFSLDGKDRMILILKIIFQLV